MYKHVYVNSVLILFVDSVNVDCDDIYYKKVGQMMLPAVFYVTVLLTQVRSFWAAVVAPGTKDWRWWNKVHREQERILLFLLFIYILWIAWYHKTSIDPLFINFDYKYIYV